MGVITSLKWLDGCDMIGSDANIGQRYAYPNGVYWAATGGRWGGGALRCNAGGTGQVGFLLGGTFGNPTPIFAGASFKQDIETNTCSFFKWYSQGTVQLEVAKTSAGYVQILRGSTVLATSATPLLVNGVWNRVETKAYIADSGGYCEVYVDGGLFVSVTGVDTKNAATAGVDRLDFLGPFNDSGKSMWIDDIVVYEGSGYVGDCRVSAMAPSSVTSNTMTVTGAANAAAALASNNGDTSYVSSSTPGAKTVVGTAGLPVTPATIHAVQSVALSRKDDAGNRSVKVGLVSGATETQTTQVLTSNYVQKFTTSLVDPNTSTDWTSSGVNNAKLSLEIV